VSAMSSKFRITIASPPDREKLVAEVFFDDEQVAEINQEADELQVEIYPRPSATPWVLSHGDFAQRRSSELLSRTQWHPIPTITYRAGDGSSRGTP
jgi:hypothetical protein